MPRNHLFIFQSNFTHHAQTSQLPMFVYLCMHKRTSRHCILCRPNAIRCTVHVSLHFSTSACANANADVTPSTPARRQLKSSKQQLNETVNSKCLSTSHRICFLCHYVNHAIYRSLREDVSHIEFPLQRFAKSFRGSLAGFNLHKYTPHSAAL